MDPQRKKNLKICTVKQHRMTSQKSGENELVKPQKKSLKGVLDFANYIGPEQLLKETKQIETTFANLKKTIECCNVDDRSRPPSKTMECDTEKHNSELIFGCTETNSVSQETFQSYTDIDSALDESKTKEKLKNIYDQQKRAENRAKRRARSQQYRALETQEEAAIRRARRLYTETPEQAEKRRIRDREYKRLKRAKETPEQTAQRRARCQEYHRQIREQRNRKKRPEQLLKETKQIETTFANLKKTIECSNGLERSRPPSRTMECDTEKHNSRELIFGCTETNFVSQETFQSFTDIDSALHDSKTKEKVKYIYDQQKREEISAKKRARWQQCRALETPEEAAIRRARRRVYYSLETPEKAEKRQARNREYMRLKRAKETPEQTADRLARCREHYRQLRSGQNKKKGKGQNLKYTERVEIAFANSNTTTESSNGQEYSQPPSEIIESDTVKHIPEEIKKERFQDEYSIFECSETSFITQEIFQYNTNFDSLLDASTMEEKCKNKETGNQHSKSKRILRKVNEDSEVTLERFDCIKMFLDAEARRDKHFVYGEYIATRLRNCKREESEIRKAKDLMQTILFYLNAGVYYCAKNK